MFGPNGPVSRRLLGSDNTTAWHPKNEYTKHIFIGIEKILLYTVFCIQYLFFRLCLDGTRCHYGRCLTNGVFRWFRQRGPRVHNGLAVNVRQSMLLGSLRGGPLGGLVVGVLGPARENSGTSILRSTSRMVVTVSRKRRVALRKSETNGVVC
jgi:hypothetical protein